MPSTNQYLMISDLGFEETQCCGLWWQLLFEKKQKTKTAKYQNAKYPKEYSAGAHPEGGWECVRTAATASINNCHLDMTQQDSKEKSGNGVIFTLFLSTAYSSSPVVEFFSIFPSMKMSLNLDYTIYFNNKLAR